VPDTALQSQHTAEELRQDCASSGNVKSVS